MILTNAFLNSLLKMQIMRDIYLPLTQLYKFINILTNIFSNCL